MKIYVNKSIIVFKHFYFYIPSLFYSKYLPLTVILDDRMSLGYNQMPDNEAWESLKIDHIRFFLGKGSQKRSSRIGTFSRKENNPTIQCCTGSRNPLAVFCEHWKWAPASGSLGRPREVHPSLVPLLAPVPGKFLAWSWFGLDCPSTPTPTPKLCSN